LHEYIEGRGSFNVNSRVLLLLNGVYCCRCLDVIGVVIAVDHNNFDDISPSMAPPEHSPQHSSPPFRS
jgi:hypothetical protein